MRKLSILFILLLTASVSIFSQSDNNAPDFPQVKAPTELMKASPAQVGIDALALESGIRAIILEALDSAAFPGCQILLAKGGKIFYEESFGYHTYDKRIAVKNSDIYDLASVTKTTAATLSLMKLYDQGLFDPNEKVTRNQRGIKVLILLRITRPVQHGTFINGTINKPC